MKTIKEIEIHHDIVVFEKIDELADEVVYPIYDNGKEIYQAWRLADAYDYIDHYYGTNLKGEE